MSEPDPYERAERIARAIARIVRLILEALLLCVVSLNAHWSVTVALCLLTAFTELTPLAIRRIVKRERTEWLYSVSAITYVCPRGCGSTQFFHNCPKRPS